MNSEYYRAMALASIPIDTSRAAKRDSPTRAFKPRPVSMRYFSHNTDRERFFFAAAWLNKMLGVRTMEIWQIIVIPILTVVLNFLAKPLEIFFIRKRMGAINSIRVLSEFFYKNQGKLTDENGISAVTEFEDWLKSPNALGSESRVAALVGRVCAILSVSENDIRMLDRALNALDQRATERERSK